MKKIKTLFLITFFFSLFSTNINAEKSNNVGINKVISGEVCYRSKRNCYPLEEGKYIIFAKEGTHDYFGYDLFESARVENNQILATFDFFLLVWPRGFHKPNAENDQRMHHRAGKIDFQRCACT